jgi:hypothetical protein
VNQLRRGPLSRLLALESGVRPLVQFAVTLKDGEWTVFKDGEVLTNGMSRSRAIEEAERLAYAAVRAGEQVELLVQDYIGQLISRRTL